MHRRSTPRDRMESARGLDKRTPRNSKYDGVESKLDTGLTVKKVRVISTREFLKRQNEAFRRISPAQLYELFAEYEEEEEINEGFSDYHGPRIVTIDESETAAEYSRPYLLLDVRERDAFEECHILQARSFPASMLRQDKMIPELYSFKNKEGTLIIMYDDNERNSIAARAADRLVERGFDNVFLLSKGIYGFSEKFQSYVEGQLPEDAVPPTRGSSRGRTSNSRASSSGSVSSHRSRLDHGAAEDDNMSRMSNLSVADTVISRASARKGKF